jgi:hypothetical protein
MMYSWIVARDGDGSRQVADVFDSTSPQHCQTAYF